MIAQEQAEVAKAEGSRGGIVIGHTSSGKAVYADYSDQRQRHFTATDHREAADAHSKRSREHYDPVTGKDEFLGEHHSVNAYKHREAAEAADLVEQQAKTETARLRALSRVHFGQTRGEVDPWTQRRHPSASRTRSWKITAAGEAAVSKAGDMEKAAGDRGGKVIGRTKSGKPIYELHHESIYAFSAAEHKDAAAAHRKKVTVGGWNGVHHEKRAKLHEDYAQDAKKSAHATETPMDALNELRQFNEALEKGGAGSRGGKVVGHTKSGKPIYESHGHAGHAGFGVREHTDAEELHQKLWERHDRKAAAARWGGGRDEKAEAAASHHEKQRVAHRGKASIQIESNTTKMQNVKKSGPPPASAYLDPARQWLVKLPDGDGWAYDRALLEKAQRGAQRGGQGGLASMAARLIEECDEPIRKGLSAHRVVDPRVWGQTDGRQPGSK